MSRNLYRRNNGNNNPPYNPGQPNLNYSPRIFVNEDCNLITIAGKLVQIKRECN